MASPMTLRVWRTEVRRQVGLLIFVVWVAVSCALLFTHPEWAGELASFATEQRSDVIVLGPIAITLAVWAGGRDRRRGLTELLDTTPNAGWRRHAVRWAALTATLCVGLLVSSAIGAYYVLGHTTYLGGRWWATLLLAGAGLGALTALGLAIGSLVPWRVVAPIAGIATYVGLGVPGYLPYLGGQHLLPNGLEGLSVGKQPALLPTALAVLFFGLITIALIAAMSPGARRAVLPAAAAALVLGVVVGLQPQTWWSPFDASATTPVCTTDLPRVCVLRTHAELLPAVTAQVRPILDSLGNLAPPAGAQERVEAFGPQQGGDRVIPLSLGGQIPLVGNHLSDPSDFDQQVTQSASLQCYDPRASVALSTQQFTWTTELDEAWSGLLFAGTPAQATPRSAVPIKLRSASTSQQRQFLHEYQTAGEACDYTAIHRLYDSWVQ